MQKTFDDREMPDARVHEKFLSVEWNVTDTGVQMFYFSRLSPTISLSLSSISLSLSRPLPENFPTLPESVGCQTCIMLTRWFQIPEPMGGGGRRCDVVQFQFALH